MTFDQVAGLHTGMLAFARSLQLSEALLWGQKSDGTRVPIEVFEKGVRGQTSSAPSSKADKELNEGQSNIQTVDAAVMPPETERFVISVTLRVLGGAMAPHASDNAAVSLNFQHLAQSYAAQGGFNELARRYVANILNGRFAWRNRFQTDKARVSLQAGALKIEADPLALPLSRLATVEEMISALSLGSADDLQKIIGLFADALAGNPCVFDLEWGAEQRPGDEVFPSQEYLRAEAAERLKGRGGQDGGKSRVYATIAYYTGGRVIRQASIHSQKIGAALRHIDDWHNDASYGPISVNAYGGVQETGAVLRASTSPSAKSFYKIMAKPAELLADLAKPAASMGADTHFFFANLVRGGVYGVAPSEKKPKGKAKEAAAQAEMGL